MSTKATTATTQPVDRSLLMFVLVAAVVFGATVALLAGGAWPIVICRLIVDGGFALLWLLAAAGLGYSILSLGRVRMSDSNALNFATSAAVGLGVMSLLVLGLGLLGWLNRISAIVLIVFGLAVGAVQLIRVIRRTAFSLPRVTPRAWLWLIVVVPAAVASAAAFVPPGLLWGDEPNGYDVVEYHLQVPREWYEAGKITPLQHNVFSYFPFNVEMHYLLAMHLRGGPWAGMYLAQFMHVVFLALTVVAVYGATQRIAAALLVGTTPWTLLLAPVAYNEGGVLLFGTLAIVWAMRARSAQQMLVAGAMAGFACGVKLTAVPLVLLAVPVGWLVTNLLSLRERRGEGASKPEQGVARATPPHPNPLPVGEGIGACIAFVLAGIVTFSPWLMRNFAWTHNPVFPEATSVFGRAHFTPAQVERFEKAHSPRPDQRGLASRLKAAWQQIVIDWRYGFILLPLGIVGIGLTWRKPSTQFLTIVLLLHIIFWLGFTHLQGRFFVLAIPIVAMLAAELHIAIPGGACVISACVALVMTAPRLAQVSAAIGAEDLQSLLPEQVTDVLASDGPIALAGDAKAFLYQVPMSRLTYRTVFDVDVHEGESVIDAWTRGAPPDAMVIVDLSELKRFAQTYWAIPQPSIESDQPYIIQPKSRLR
jgi:hypothetical protein